MSPTAQFRDFLAEHLPYELAMMNHTLSRLNNPGLDWNAFMEAFCVHARNIKQFVTNDNGKGNNNVIARDFAVFGERVPSDLTGHFQRLNAQIAHLSKTRTIDSANKFTADDAQTVSTWLNHAMSKFINSLDPNDRKHWGAALLRISIPFPLAKQNTTALVAGMTIVPL
jgi:hypothetical protein